MATHPLPDFDELRHELSLLERRERQVSGDRRRLHERIDVFPSEFSLDRERQLSVERRELHARIDALRTRLGLFMPPAA